jgi:shikimate dehydrogenase
MQKQQIRKCAVIGRPINHSLSPMIHHHFANQCGIALTYEKILGDEKEFKKQVIDFFDNHGCGLNVTLPFKEQAYQLAQESQNFAVQAKSANTLYIDADGQICAANTDGIGLLFSLQRAIHLENKHLLILGAGGAVRGVLPILQQQPLASITVANRSQDKLQKLQTDFPDINTILFANLTQSYDVVINGTSSSLQNQVPDIPDQVVQGSFVLDMAYDLLRDTAFMRFALENGAQQTVDGLEMLIGQAAESFKIWHGITVDPIYTLQACFQR